MHLIVTFEATTNFMKKFILYIILLFATFATVHAQYYYNDLLATQQSNAQQKLLLNNKVRTVTAISKEADNSTVEGFLVQQKINKDASEIVTETKNGESVVSTLFSYYNNGIINKTKTITKDIFTVTDYIYDAAGLLQNITSATTDTFMNSFTSEHHIWFFNAEYQPTKMYRIKNNTDTTFVEFVLDDQKMVAVENWKRNGRYTEAYYYYYNEKKQLTDIVRFNSTAQKMLPDFMFEYDATGRIKQMIQVLAAGKNYNTWRYTYLENGLKQKETCYDKQKQLVGAIEYSYAY